MPDIRKKDEFAVSFSLMFLNGIYTMVIFLLHYRYTRKQRSLLCVVVCTKTLTTEAQRELVQCILTLLKEMQSILASNSVPGVR